MKLREKQKHQIRQYFKQQPEAVAVYLYGSQVKKSAGLLSDVDIGVLLKKEIKKEEYLDLHLEYIKAVQGILEEDLAADVKILNQDQALIYLQSVIAEGKVLVINNEREKENFESRIALLFADFYPVLRDYFVQMNERLDKGSYAA